MFAKETYINRRKALKSKVKSGIILVPGNEESAMSYPANTYHFRQDSNFLYFFGLNHPHFIGVIDIDNNTDYLFGDDVEIDDIIWMGPQPSIAFLAEQVGINHTDKYNAIYNMVRAAIAKGRKIHFLPAYRGEQKLFYQDLLGIHPNLLANYYSTELIKAVVELRSIKDKDEIKEIEKAIEIGYEMHTTAMRMCKPGVMESDIAGAIEGIAIARGSMVSFPVILSQNGETLHNHYHGNKLEAGRLMLTDAGAETTMNYCSDFTRTIPVSGKFTQQQREIYQLVLDANMRAIEMSAPGIRYLDVHLEAAKVIASGLKALGLMKGNVDDAVAQGAHALFFPHGLGHMMGLDVHDMEGLGEDFVGYDETIQRSSQFGTAYLRLAKKLKPGYVFTDEPGIYFIPALIDMWKKENKFTDFINYDKLEAYRSFGGIRIEDDLLVTENGCRVLGKPIPKTINEIEKIMGE